MLAKLQEVSKIVIIPAAVLYTLGFLVEAAYLARFGMINFDILNTRFLIAGIFPAVCLIFTVLPAFSFYKHMPANKLFSREHRTIKYAAYFLLVGGTFSFSYILSIIFSLGAYISPTKEDFLVFGPFMTHLLGGYDLPGRIAALVPHISVGYDFILKVGLYLGLYALVIVFSVVLAARVLSYFFGGAQAADAETLHAGRDEVAIQKGQPSKTDLFLNSSFGLAIDIFVLSFVVAIFTYCVLKVLATNFDFHSFNQGYKLSGGLLFVWMFPSTMIFYLFFNFFSRSEEGQQLMFDWGSKFKNMGDVNDMLQQLVYPLFLSIFLFGSVVFPRIPYAVGGGMPRVVEMQTSIAPQYLASSTLYLLDESTQYLFIVAIKENSASAVQISKDKVDYFVTRSTSTKSRLGIVAPRTTKELAGPLQWAYIQPTTTLRALGAKRSFDAKLK